MKYVVLVALGVVKLSCLVATLKSLPRRVDRDCKWRDNVTDVLTIERHKYMILEDCLYYSLSKKANNDYGKNGALILLPPTRTNKKIPITIHMVNIRQVMMSWFDDRMMWNQDWKLDVLKIKSFGHLWMPDIHSDRYKTTIQGNEFTSYQQISAFKNGTVKARMEYRMQALCSTDYANYPTDLKKCCLNLKSILYPELVQFSVQDYEGHLDLHSVRSNWDLRASSLIPENNDKIPRVRFCLTIGRKSSTLRLQLTLPMTISALLVLIAPLAGDFQKQIFMKLFAILLQFLCFNFLVDKTPNLGFGDSVPKIYKFYEFTLLLTLISLLVSVLISAMSRVKRALPPPHNIQLMAGGLNSKLCCSEEKAASPDPGRTESGTVSYHDDWLSIFVAANNVLSILMMLVYVLGTIVLLR